MATTTALLAWSTRCLPKGVALPPAPVLAPLNGDAGFRQYFRLDSTPPLIAVYAPPDKENNPAFVAKGGAMKRAGVNVPRVYAVDFQQGFMLQQDLGDDLLLPRLNPQTLDDLYGRAERELARIQRVAADGAVFPPYDQTLLRQEMNLFPQWFVADLLACNLSPEEENLLDETFKMLEDSALAQPQVVVHRDYHSRNLLLAADGGLGVVDFQDAVIGAFSYDLVSLLKDCYIRWPAELVRQRALTFLAARASELGVAVAPEQLVRWFDFMGLQRHIKVLGIFARLWLRDGKARYLDDLPLVMRYTLEVAAAYPELAHFHQWFVDKLLPRTPQQAWYRDWQTAGE